MRTPVPDADAGCMNEHLNHSFPHQPVPSGQDPKGGRLNWALIAGLAAFALLWPLAELTGMPSGLLRVAVIFTVTAVCWIGVVGFGRFARPVLTLTLVGVGAGVLSQALGLAIGGDSGPVLWAVPIAVAMQAGWGALAGLLAWAIQSMRTEHTS